MCVRLCENVKYEAVEKGVLRYSTQPKIYRSVLAPYRDSLSEHWGNGHNTYIDIL